MTGLLPVVAGGLLVFKDLVEAVGLLDEDVAKEIGLMQQDLHLESAKPVEVEATFTLRRNLYTYEKRTRPAGSSQPFEFRDGYTFTRIEPAVIPAGSK